jgi:hypothetical protein
MLLLCNIIIAGLLKTNTPNQYEFCRYLRRGLSTPCSVLEEWQKGNILRHFVWMQILILGKKKQFQKIPGSICPGVLMFMLIGLGLKTKIQTISNPKTRKFLFAPDNLSSLSVQEINYWLSKFCMDVRQQNGEEYKHKVLYSLFCPINRVICESKPGLVLFKSPELKQLQNVSDGRLKYLQSKQDPFQKKARSFSKES